MSTSAARRLPASRSPPKRSARTGGCRSRTSITTFKALHDSYPTRERHGGAGRVVHRGAGADRAKEPGVAPRAGDLPRAGGPDGRSDPHAVPAGAAVGGGRAGAAGGRGGGGGGGWAGG